MMKKPLTLCIIREPKRVLLGMKKKGFGKGRWNGFGGKVEKGESIEEATKREMKEEAGVEVFQMEKVGIIQFEFKGNPEILEVHIFRGDTFTGKPKESEEMKPRWFSINKIPFDKMWPDDIYWFPLFLKGDKFKGRFLFGPGDSVLKYTLKSVKMVS